MSLLTSAEQSKLNAMCKVARDVSLGTHVGMIQKISQAVVLADFTDGGAAVGTLALDDAIPAGATFLYGNLLAVVGFAGDTSAALTVGDGTDVDRYNASTVNVFASIAGGVGLGDPAGTRYHAAEKTPTITITAGSDWGSVTAGGFTIELFYLT